MHQEYIDDNWSISLKFKKTHNIAEAYLAFRNI